MKCLKAICCNFLYATIVLMVAHSAHATIAVTNSVNGITGTSGGAGGDGILFTSASFDMMPGANAVGFLVTTEGAGDSSIRNATFAGQSMNSVNVEDNGAGDQTATIFWLIDPASTLGTFSFVVDANYDNGGSGGIAYAYSQIALSNVADVAGTATARSTSNSNTTPLPVTDVGGESYSYVTTTDGGFVLGAAANNDFNNARQLSVSSGNPDTDLLSHTLVGSSGHFHTYGDIPSAGTYTDSYLGQYQRTAIASVAFNAVAVPEANQVLAILCCGSALGMVKLVRKRLAA